MKSLNNFILSAWMITWLSTAVLWNNVETAIDTTKRQYEKTLWKDLLADMKGYLDYEWEETEEDKRSMNYFFDKKIEEFSKEKYISKYVLDMYKKELSEIAENQWKSLNIRKEYLSNWDWTESPKELVEKINNIDFPWKIIETKLVESSSKLVIFIPQIHADPFWSWDISGNTKDVQDEISKIINTLHNNWISNINLFEWHQNTWTLELIPSWFNNWNSFNQSESINWVLNYWLNDFDPLIDKTFNYVKNIKYLKLYLTYNFEIEYEVLKDRLIINISELITQIEKDNKYIDNNSIDVISFINNNIYSKEIKYIKLLDIINSKLKKSESSLFNTSLRDLNALKQINNIFQNIKTNSLSVVYGAAHTKNMSKLLNESNHSYIIIKPDSLIMEK